MRNSFEKAWIAPLLTDLIASDSERLSIHIIENNNKNRTASILTLDTEHTICAVTAEVFDQCTAAIKANTQAAVIKEVDSLNGLIEILEGIGFLWFSSDYIYYLLPEQLAELPAPPTSENISCRPLALEDLTHFDEFIAEVSASEQGEAWVQLVHLKSYGLFVNDKLTCVCSAQPWSVDGTFQDDFINIADVGIITHPQHRCQGFAKRLLQSIAPQLAAEQYTLQFRTPNDNFAAIHLAESLTLNYFGVSENLVWDEE